MSDRECKKCGGKIGKYDYSCPECGSDAINAGEWSAKENDAEKSPTGNLDICPDCGAQVSRRAVACPKCGAPLKETTVVYGKPDWGYEWRTDAELLGLPIIHVAFGRKNGKLRVAKGIVAIGQFAFGMITIAQFGVGLLFGLGQFIFGFTAIAPTFPPSPPCA